MLLLQQNGETCIISIFCVRQIDGKQIYQILPEFDMIYRKLTDLEKKGAQKVTSIKKYISIIFNDFKEYVDKNDNLCVLKTINYQAGQKPDYSDIHIQQLYLLRYVFSYAFEYKSMFATLFEREVFRDTIVVSSVGCGNMIDYWGLVEALDEAENSRCKIKYRGVDIVDWNYKMEARAQDEINFIKANAAVVFKKARTLESNVYIFPKSISEFSNEDFEIICKCFSKKEIQNDRIHVLVSLRSDQGSMDRDMERSAKIISALKKNGFVTEDNATTYIYYEDEDTGIKKIDNKFEYPNRALEFITSLNTECSTYLSNGGNCADDCKNLNRWPVLKAKNIRFQVLTFNRKDSL